MRGTRRTKRRAIDATGRQLELRLMVDDDRPGRTRDAHRDRPIPTRSAGVPGATGMPAAPIMAGSGESLVAILAIVLVGVISAALHAGAV